LPLAFAAAGFQAATFPQASRNPTTHGALDRRVVSAHYIVVRYT
jgi:hypothetical protein